MSPIWITFLRCALGTLIVIPFLILKQENPFKHLKYWKQLAVLALLTNVIPFTLCSYGEVYSHSATAGVIEGTIPIFTAVLTWIFFPHTKIQRYEYAGLAIGFLGLLLVFLPAMLDSVDDNALGRILLVLMAMSFATGFVFFEKKVDPSIPLFSLMTLQLIFSSMVLAPVTLLVHPVNPGLFDSSTWMAVLIVSFTSLVGWVIYYSLAKTTPAYFLSIATYLCPLIAILLGAVFLGEILSKMAYAGTALVVGSMVIMTGMLNRVFMRTRFLNRMFGRLP